MEFLEEEDVEALKKKLRQYSREHIIFNEPHFTQQLILREGNREQVIAALLHPDQLTYSYQERGTFGDIIHCLHFIIDNTKTLRLPVIFDKNGRKSLYILTYILRYRSWQHMVKQHGKNRLL